MLKFLSIAICSAALVPAAATSQSASRATVRTDARWYPWLGCWQSDSAGTESGLKCIVPARGSTAVDELTLIDGKVVSRDRLDANDRPHQIRQQGCDGMESVMWSASGRRVYLRSDYVCNTGIRGVSTRLFSMLPSGEWLEVENVRSGTGSIARTVRRRDVGVPSAVPSDVRALVSGERLAIATSRAGSAAPIDGDDVLDALHHTDAATVRAWIVATDQRFDLDGRQVASLVRADVPASVLQAMLASAPGLEPGGLQRSVASDEYLNTPGYRPGGATQSTTIIYGAAQPSPENGCTPAGCYGPNAYSVYNGSAYYPYVPYSSVAPYPVGYPVFGVPIIVRRGRDRFTRPIPRAVPHGPARPISPMRPVGPVGRRP